MNIRIPKDHIGQEELMLRCDCSHPHVASFSYFDDEKDFINLMLTYSSSRSWYKRWWSALKYAFGIHDRYMYDELVLTNNDAEAIIAFLQEYLNEEKS